MRLRIISVNDPEIGGWIVDRIGNFNMRMIKAIGIQWRDATEDEIAKYHSERS